MKIIKLTLTDGTPVFYNTNHVVSFWRNAGKKFTYLETINSPDDSFDKVKESMEEIRRLIEN